MFWPWFLVQGTLPPTQVISMLNGSSSITTDCCSKGQTNLNYIRLRIVLKIVSKSLIFNLSCYRLKSVLISLRENGISNIPSEWPYRRTIVLAGQLCRPGKTSVPRRPPSREELLCPIRTKNQDFWEKDELALWQLSEEKMKWQKHVNWTSLLLPAFNPK